MMKDYKEYYKLPLKLDSEIGWVWDSKDNFVFQFEFDDVNEQNNIIDAIEGKINLSTNSKFRYEDGLISYENGTPAILMRGWGNLTGTGCYNLSPCEAEYVQDTFAEFILSQLNK